MTNDGAGGVVMALAGRTTRHPESDLMALTFTASINLRQQSWIFIVALRKVSASCAKSLFENASYVQQAAHCIWQKETWYSALRRTSLIDSQRSISDTHKLAAHVPLYRKYKYFIYWASEVAADLSRFICVFWQQTNYTKWRQLTKSKRFIEISNTLLDLQNTNIP